MKLFKRLFGGKEEVSLSEKGIISFIDQLISTNDKTREQAFEALRDAGDAAVQPLIEALEHDNLMIRRQAAEALGMINSKVCINNLLNIFNDPRPEMFRRANYVLWRIGEPAVSGLIEKLQDEDPNVRGRAAIALGEMIHRRRADPSNRLWLDPSAIDATDKIREDIDVEKVRTKAKEPLKKLLQDNDNNAKKYALRALEKGYLEPHETEKEGEYESESVTQRNEAGMGALPVNIKPEERDQKRKEWLDEAEKLKKEGQNEKAIEYWDLVIRANLDGNGWAHYLKGSALAELDRPEEAAECLKEALGLDPDSSGYALELGSVLYKLGQWTEARSTFKKVVAMDGIVFGHDDKAMEWLKRLDEEGH
jgi:tetratricopeptide (TPR) repeat protein